MNSGSKKADNSERRKELAIRFIQEANKAKKEMGVRIISITGKSNY